MPRMFADQIALVTGGGSGIGRTTARALAREGATVVVAGRTDEPLAQAVKLIVTEGGQASAVTADVTRSDDVARLVDTVVTRHGRLDIAVNNAAIIGAPGPLATLDEDAWSAVLSVNITGVWLCMKHEITHMRAHTGGVIVNIASAVGAHLRLPGLGAYAASKAAVSALTGAAARECIADGIRINAVSPGPVDTTMSLLPGESDADRTERMRTALPIGRVATTEEISDAVLWLASPASSFVVGQDLVIDGGATA